MSENMNGPAWRDGSRTREGAWWTYLGGARVEGDTVVMDILHKSGEVRRAQPLSQVGLPGPLSDDQMGWLVARVQESQKTAAGPFGAGDQSKFFQYDLENAVVTINEYRASKGLPRDERFGDMTLAEYMAENMETYAKAAAARMGLSGVRDSGAPLGGG